METASCHWVPKAWHEEGAGERMTKQETKSGQGLGVAPPPTCPQPDCFISCDQTCHRNSPKEEEPIQLKVRVFSSGGWTCTCRKNMVLMGEILHNMVDNKQEGQGGRDQPATTPQGPTSSDLLPSVSPPPKVIEPYKQPCRLESEQPIHSSSYLICVPLYPHDLVSRCPLEL